MRTANPAGRQAGEARYLYRPGRSAFMREWTRNRRSKLADRWADSRPDHTTAPAPPDKTAPALLAQRWHELRWTPMSSRGWCRGSWCWWLVMVVGLGRGGRRDDN